MASDNGHTTPPTGGLVAVGIGTAGSGSGEGEREVMGIPQVPGQVRRAPVAALRAVFAAFGRLVMLADRQPPVVVVTEPDSRNHSLEQTGNVRLLRAEEAPVRPEPAVDHQAARAADLPLPNYDTLSLASIRARLRGLDVAQLKVLLDYEATNAERTEVLGMFERRIEKLEAGA